MEAGGLPVTDGFAGDEAGAPTGFYIGRRAQRGRAAVGAGGLPCGREDGRLYFTGKSEH